MFPYNGPHSNHVTLHLNNRINSYEEAKDGLGYVAYYVGIGGIVINVERDNFTY